MVVFAVSTSGGAPLGSGGLAEPFPTRSGHTSTQPSSVEDEGFSEGISDGWSPVPRQPSLWYIRVYTEMFR